jgi:DNA-binding beta-propeller fold protein YncE
VTRGRIIALAIGVVAVVAVVVGLLLAGGSSTSPPPVQLAADPYAHASGATTLAGTGSPAFNGDGLKATSADLDGPSGLAEDRAGDLFIADTDNCRVRELPARSGTSFGVAVRQGRLATIAGGPCSDHSEPVALAVDSAGDLYIAFGSADRVEELPASNASTFGVPVTAGKLVTIAGTGRPGSSSNGEPAGQVTLDDPTGLAVDASGDLLIADTANCRVLLVAASTGTRFGMPVLRDHSYTLAGNGICGSAGDGGPATVAEVWDPGALAVDPNGNVLIADQGNRSIRELAARGGTFYGISIAADHLGTVAGEGSYGPYLLDGLPAVGETAELNFPTAIVVDSRGDLYVADGADRAIRFVPATSTTLSGKPAQDGDMYTAAGALGTGSLHNVTSWIQTRMLEPTGLALSPDGSLVFSDSQGDVVRKLPPGT